MNRGFIKVVAAVSLAVVVLLTLLLAGPIGAKPGGNGIKSATINGGYGYCAFTPGGWGSECHGNNVGCLRDAGWGTVVGTNPLVVGTGNFSLTFTLSADVAAYLPSGGTPASLTANALNPTGNEGGVLGGHTTALKLNVLYSTSGLGGVTVSDPLFPGITTVSQLLALAEAVLGATPNALDPYPGATVSDLSDACAAINEGYGDCGEDD